MWYNRITTFYEIKCLPESRDLSKIKIHVSLNVIHKIKLNTRNHKGVHKLIKIWPNYTNPA